MQGVEKLHGIKGYRKGRGGESVNSLMLHYTVGGGGPRAVYEFMVDTDNSYHYVVGDGHAVEMVDPQHTAHHGRGVAVGEKRYVPRQANRRSIGLAFCNWGHMSRTQAEDRGLENTVDRYVPRVGRRRQWEPYAPIDIDVAASLVVDHLQPTHKDLVFVTGHEDAEKMKSDPGPLFPWQYFLDKTLLVRALRAEDMWLFDFPSAAAIAAASREDRSAFFERVLRNPLIRENPSIRTLATHVGQKLSHRNRGF